MIPALDDLLTAALALGGDDTVVAHGGAMWRFEGGRPCPIGWDDCSQSVYVDLVTGNYDYGDQGGPGHADCLRHCRHGRVAPEMPEPAPGQADLFAEAS